MMISPMFKVNRCRILERALPAMPDDGLRPFPAHMEAEIDQWRPARL